MGAYQSRTTVIEDDNTGYNGIPRDVRENPRYRTTESTATEDYPVAEQINDSPIVLTIKNKMTGEEFYIGDLNIKSYHYDSREKRLMFYLSNLKGIDRIRIMRAITTNNLGLKDVVDLEIRLKSYLEEIVIEEGFVSAFRRDALMNLDILVFHPIKVFDMGERIVKGIFCVITIVVAIATIIAMPATLAPILKGLIAVVSANTIVNNLIGIVNTIAGDDVIPIEDVLLESFEYALESATYSMGLDRMYEESDEAASVIMNTLYTIEMCIEIYNFIDELVKIRKITNYVDDIGKRADDIDAIRSDIEFGENSLIRNDSRNRLEQLKGNYDSGLNHNINQRRIVDEKIDNLNLRYDEYTERVRVIEDIASSSKTSRRQRRYWERQLSNAKDDLNNFIEKYFENINKWTAKADRIDNRIDMFRTKLDEVINDLNITDNNVALRESIEEMLAKQDVEVEKLADYLLSNKMTIDDTVKSASSQAIDNYSTYSNSKGVLTALVKIALFQMGKGNINRETSSESENKGTLINIINRDESGERELISLDGAIMKMKLNANDSLDRFDVNNFVGSNEIENSEKKLVEKEIIIEVNITGINPNYYPLRNRILSKNFKGALIESEAVNTRRLTAEIIERNLKENKAELIQEFKINNFWGLQSINQYNTGMKVVEVNNLDVKSVVESSEGMKVTFFIRDDKDEHINDYWVERCSNGE